MIAHLVLAAGCYLLGSVSWSYWVVRGVRGSDLRSTGSGNLGARNAARAAGWRWGALVGLADAAKGASAVWLASTWLGSELAQGVALFCVVLGHCHSVFLRGAGGKGLAAGIGGLLLLSPFTLGVAVGAGVVALVLTRDLYAMAVVAVLVVGPAYVVVRGSSWALAPLGALVGLVLCRHRRHLPPRWWGRT